MAYNGFASKNRVFQPNLAGRNHFELTFVDYAHNGVFLNQYLANDGTPAKHEDPHMGVYLMGFCLAIGSFRGLVGSENDRVHDRVVQIHCDWWSKAGLWFVLNRNMLEEDQKKIRFWEGEADAAKMVSTITVRCPVRTPPATCLAWRHDPFGDGTPWDHRWGLGIIDDGRRLFWTLDGIVMDIVDISGFFDSSPGSVSEGAYATVVGGASYQENMWTVAGLSISVGPAAQAEG
jgi:hypothetical protein